ncbi:hypothetical protein PMIN02_009815 [Paraphaeosphaeria minitans]
MATLCKIIVTDGKSHQISSYIMHMTFDSFGSQSRSIERLSSRSVSSLSSKQRGLCLALQGRSKGQLAISPLEETAYFSVHGASKIYWIFRGLAKNISDMATSKPRPPLTFGVELEFICVYKENAFVKIARHLDVGPDVGREKIRHVQSGHAIWYKLNEAGIATCCRGKDEGPATTPYSRWMVDFDDHGLTGKEQSCVPRGYLKHALELASPVLGLDDERSFQQIERVLQILASMEARFDCRFITNRLCGLHVHMGCGKGTIVPLPVAKRVFQLTTAHEHNLDAMHAASRVVVPVSTTNIDTDAPYIPLSFFHRGGQLGLGNHNVFDWLKRIEEVRSNADFAEFFAFDWGDEILNFDNLWLSESSDHAPKTIEFRQHVGTLDFAEISRYVRFLGNVLAYCYQADDGPFVELLMKATDANFTVEHLMEVVGGPAQACALVPGQIVHDRHHSTPAQRAVGRDPLRPLDTLVDQNAHEVAANHQNGSITDTRARKSEVGLYGVDHRSNGLSLHPDAIPGFIVDAAGSLLASNPGMNMDELSSQARAVTFGRLAEKYRELRYLGRHQLGK